MVTPETEDGGPTIKGHEQNDQLSCLPGAILEKPSGLGHIGMITHPRLYTGNFWGGGHVLNLDWIAVIYVYQGLLN